MSDPLTLTSLPLFPLNTVLFPGGVLPLRVFEVRYLDMVRKCHRAGAPFGVVALARGHEVRQAGALPESLYSVGTLAMIEHLDELQAGLMHVRCRGIARFRVVRQQLLPHGLWTANVEQIPCDTPVQVPPDLQRAASTLTQVLSSLPSRRQEQPGDQPHTHSPHAQICKTAVGLPIAGASYCPFRWNSSSSSCNWTTRWCGWSW